jgi:hypothetical protein
VAATSPGASATALKPLVRVLVLVIVFVSVSVGAGVYV